MLLSKKEMLDRLRNNVVLVNFTKANGEARDMYATLMASKLPEYQRTNDDDYAESDTLRVFDVVADGWRSFRLDSVNWTMTPSPLHG